MEGLFSWRTATGSRCLGSGCGRCRMAECGPVGLEAGYRHVDTAQAYGNEESVGQGPRESGLSREEVFITTKFYPAQEDPAAEAARSVERLRVDYVDRYIIHWPQGVRPGRGWGWRGLASLGMHGRSGSRTSASVSLSSYWSLPWWIRCSSVLTSTGARYWMLAGTPGSRSRRIARWGTVATSPVKPSSESRNAWGARPPRCCCAGVSSATFR
jgi:hypothetical protein